MDVNPTQKNWDTTNIYGKTELVMQRKYFKGISNSKNLFIRNNETNSLILG